MSAISSIGSSTSTTASSKGLSGLSGQDFMNLLVQQLSNQDPMQPMSNEEMLNQISTIREVEMNSRLTEQLQKLSDQQRFGASASLIGKMVKGTVKDDAGTEYTKQGMVNSVVYGADGNITLQLDSGDSLPLNNLEEVSGVALKSASANQKLVRAS